ncbi:Uncharacterised protein [uncultured archaeon]|nr:Uncharacterised protein [uncultured archaeon]
MAVEYSELMKRILIKLGNESVEYHTRISFKPITGASIRCVSPEAIYHESKANDPIVLTDQPRYIGDKISDLGPDYAKQGSIDLNKLYELECIHLIIPVGEIVPEIDKYVDKTDKKLEVLGFSDSDLSRNNELIVGARKNTLVVNCELFTNSFIRQAYIEITHYFKDIMNSNEEVNLINYANHLV